MALHARREGDTVKLEELKELCEKATPGPWFFDKEGGPEHEGNEHGVVWFSGPYGRTAVFDSCYWDMADAKLAAAARTYMPKLIAVVEAAKRTTCAIEGSSVASVELREAIEVLEAET